MTDHTTSASPVSTLPPAEEPTPFIRQRPVRLIINSFLVLFVVALIAFRFVPGWLDPDFSKHIESHRVMLGPAPHMQVIALGVMLATATGSSAPQRAGITVASQRRTLSAMFTPASSVEPAPGTKPAAGPTHV